MHYILGSVNLLNDFLFAYIIVRFCATGFDNGRVSTIHNSSIPASAQTYLPPNTVSDLALKK